jgi:peptide/nickel transport system permease protein
VTGRIAAVALSPASASKQKSRWRQVVRGVFRDSLVAVCLIWLLAVAVAAIFGSLVAPHAATSVDLTSRLLPPMSKVGNTRFLLGTDEFGRDYLSRLIVGARTSVAIGIGASLLSVIIGGLLGGLAGYLGGLADSVCGRVIDAMLSFPTLLLSLLVLVSVGPSPGAVVAVLTCAGTPLVARLARGLSVETRKVGYIESAKALGSRDIRVFLRHVVPNIFGPILVYGTILIAVMMLSEASLDFLGLGAQPPQTSWGLLAADGQDYIYKSWWLVTFPGLAIFLTTLSINLVSSRLRALVEGSSRPRGVMLAAAGDPAVARIGQSNQETEVNAANESE